MAESQDMIVPLLREMRAAFEQRFDRVDRKLDAHVARFDTLRQAMLGESVLGRYTVAEVEERLDAIERRLAEIEARS